MPYHAFAKKVNIQTFDDLVRAERISNSTLVIKKEIDLHNRMVKIAAGSTLIFKGGSFKNGTVVGAKTKLRRTENNIFHNCEINGEWVVESANSTMFDKDVDAMTLLKNMSRLSPNLKLSTNRSYDLYAQGETIKAERLEGDGKDKPKLAFHTTNPNIDGIVIMGNNVTLRNLAVIDDYDVKNNVVYGSNTSTIGNTIAVKGPNNTVETLTIEDSDFSGGTSSSWVASSQTRNCLVNNCTFTGYMADHGVYCSMKVEIFKVMNCRINDVTHVSGLFKVRTSDRLKCFGLSNVTAHNYNGYLAVVSLLETPMAEIVFDHITVTKDEGNNSTFYGFCMSDETNNLRGKGYNSKRITVSNSLFGYGYAGNAVIYPGAGKSVCVKEIIYDRVVANESNFGGGCSDRISVNNSRFNECSGDKGIYLCTKELSIKKSKLNNSKASNCLLLANYDNDFMQKLSLQNVEIDANANTLINVVSGSQIGLLLKDCNLVKLPHDIYKAPKNCRVDVGYMNSNNIM